MMLLTFTTTAQEPVMTIGGSPTGLRAYQIIIPAAATGPEILAAQELRHYMHLLSGVELSVVSDTSAAGSSEFAIGKTNRQSQADNSETLDPDGFHLFSEGSKVYITGGTGNGTLYGVYELLERYAGCRFWAPDAETVPVTDTLVIPCLRETHKPAFQSREVYYAGISDEAFADKMRSHRHAWTKDGEWGLWVHTMFKLVPPETYFDHHPEYYSLMAGKRVATQLCLSNPEVLQITIDELRRLMESKPEKKYWSVSQMDTYGACECPSCKAIDQREGSQSGSMITFVNKIAEAFPDKVISTLAYQYTRKAPRFLRPAPNVNIMLCTIECDRSHPLSEETSPDAFIHDLKAWSAISDNILVWDYVIQFTNMIAPFPNLPVLQPNLKLFRDHGVRAVFEQGCHKTYSEMQELRQYLLAKLMWNPNLDFDSLTTCFLNGYYGNAGPYIGQYLKTMEKELKKSGEVLWIYSSPMQETNSFLMPEHIREYNRLFDLAEDAVGKDSVLFHRVSKARLPVRYAMLEIARKNITGPDGFLEQDGEQMTVRPSILRDLDTFVDQADAYGVTTVHERKKSPEEYRQTTLNFFNNAWSEHIAKGCLYSLSVPPSLKYQAEGDVTLTDGKRGSENYFVLWQGFEGTDLEAIIDLGAEKEINYAGASFLQDIASWIFLPIKLEVSISSDGDQFREILSVDAIPSPDPSLIRETGGLFTVTHARYVKFNITGRKICPEWHIGHGGRAWLFMDELIVGKR